MIGILRSANAFAKQQLPGLYDSYVEWTQRNLPQEVWKILTTDEPPRAFDDEAVFDILRRRYQQRSWPDYKFDHWSVWQRSVQRAMALLADPLFQRRGLSVLEAACGDGMTGKILAAYGHRVTLHDLADGRFDEAKDLAFFAGSLRSPLRVADGTFDLICSYNSFEHIEDPRVALAELIRIAKPGGHILLDFGPLYACPLGPYVTTLKMPYPQFLFSEQFYERKRREVAGAALGPPSMEGEAWRADPTLSEPLNKWRISRYRTLWKRSGCEIVSLTESVIDSHLRTIAEFPAAFTGRGLTLEDVTVAGIRILLRTPAAVAPIAR